MMSFVLDSAGNAAVTLSPLPVCRYNSLRSHTLTWLKKILKQNYVIFRLDHFSNLVQNHVWTVASVLLRAVKRSMQFEISSMSFAAREDTSDYLFIF